MKNLQNLYENSLEFAKFNDRKLQLDGGKILLQGAVGVGKSALLKANLAQIPKENYLYIDFSDLRVEVKFPEIADFLAQNSQISTLVLDGAENQNLDGIENLSVPNLIVATRSKSIKIDGFERLSLYGLDFEEFVAIDKRNDESAIFSAFMAAGNSPKVQMEAIFAAQNLLKRVFEKNQILTLKSAAKSVHKGFSANRVYSELKEKIKISKDSVYQNIAKFENEMAIFFVPEFAHENGTKRLYLGNFLYIDALNFQKDFIAKFANIIFCELLKMHSEIYFTKDLDFFIPARNLGILIVPFGVSEFIFLKFKKMISALKALKIQRLQAVTMSNSAIFEFEGIKCEILPFYRFALGL